MSNRIAYFDFLRGIAILMVVAIHTYSISYGNVALAIRQIFNLAVPLFLAISGYFLANKDLSSKEKYLAFLKKQVTKVYVPCIIWSIPSFLLYIRTDFSTIPMAFVLLLICGLSIYYFIALIIQFYVLLPVLQKYVKTVQMGGGNVYCLNGLYMFSHFCYADKRIQAADDCLWRKFSSLYCFLFRRYFIEEAAK